MYLNIRRCLSSKTRELHNAVLLKKSSTLFETKFSFQTNSKFLQPACLSGSTVSEIVTPLILQRATRDILCQRLVWLDLIQVNTNPIWTSCCWFGFQLEKHFIASKLMQKAVHLTGKKPVWRTSYWKALVKKTLDLCHGSKTGCWEKSQSWSASEVNIKHKFRVKNTFRRINQNQSRRLLSGARGPQVPQYFFLYFLIN